MNFSEDLESALDYTLDEDFVSSNATSTTIHHEIAAVINILTSFIGVLCDIFIIHTVLKNTRMKTRRNMILMNWAIFDALDFPIFTEAIVGFINLIYPAIDWDFEVCLLSHAAALFKLTCVFLMFLMLSTTIARMQFVTETKFHIGLYIFSFSVYICNLFICVYVSYMLTMAKFTILIVCMFIVIIIKEINICCKACRDDPISEKTKLKINLVRIYIYNYTAILFMATILFVIVDDVKSFGYVIIGNLNVSLHLTPMYMLIYLYHADENYKNALRNVFKCCCKDRVDSNLDAAVVYNERDNRDSVDFVRI